MVNEYIENRLKPQIKYYDKKSAEHQKIFFKLSLVGTVALALIPVISIGTNEFATAKYIVAALGAVGSVISSVLIWDKPKDNWVQYRVTCEKLKSELERYVYAVGPYKNLSEEDRDAKFVETCENIMCAEHTLWVTRTAKEAGQK